MNIRSLMLTSAACLPFFIGCSSSKTICDEAREIQSQKLEVKNTELEAKRLRLDRELRPLVEEAKQNLRENVLAAVKDKNACVINGGIHINVLDLKDFNIQHQDDFIYGHEAFDLWYSSKIPALQELFDSIRDQELKIHTSWSGNLCVEVSAIVPQ